MRSPQPPDDPRLYPAALVVLLATAVAFPDGAIAAGVVVVAATVVLGAPGRFRQSK